MCVCVVSKFKGSNGTLWLQDPEGTQKVRETRFSEADT